MAGPSDIYVFKDALIVLGTAAVVAPVVHRLKISPVLGFMVVGAALGPYGLGRLADFSRAIDWLTVTGERQIAFIADLGIVFLLFFIGLELSMRRMITMRRLVFGLGGLQVVLSAVVISLALYWLGQPAAAALIIGTCLALSSTAIVMELLSGQRRMMSTTGRTSFAILLAQDLAVVPLLFLISALGGHSEGSVIQGVIVAVVEAVLAVAVIAVVGRVVLKPLFRLAASTDNPEFFMAATLLIAVGSGVIAAMAGLSMALGAFIAGLLLAETEYRRAVEAMIDPFRGLLLGVFFFSVGMHIDLSFIWREPLLVIGGFIAMMAAKTVLLLPLCRFFGVPWAASVETSLLLAPGGEFAFIGIGLATQFSLVQPGVAAGVLAVVSLTMGTLPFVSLFARRAARRVAKQVTGEAPATPLPPADHEKRVIVVGHGRVGQLVCDLLDKHQISYIAADHDAVRVERWRKLGRPIYFGDASNSLFLQRCGIDEATGVIVTIDTAAVDDVVRAVRARRPDVMIVARAHDAQHARHLYTLAVTDTVPETIEASLQLAESALVGLGVPMGLVIASIHERREEVRNELQAAAGGTGSMSARIRDARREKAVKP
ncbi:cation:proton antiporter [Reyranella aquatilis]|jgi:CPA2 family monovalent cation:H+ antiporter-2|uniref:Cation:proton antiporter n=1 Tax=Reyranella aquatilis TaxID=2035356 RepID=A0ABS8KR32_9HYPH|nr:cation:proton antiporter [Reyranella aquatilis]MCC8428525.1 cation:proton antiporter [Reyranella aquatilis]